MFIVTRPLSTDGFNDARTKKGAERKNPVLILNVDLLFSQPIKKAIQPLDSAFVQVDIRVAIVSCKPPNRSGLFSWMLIHVHLSTNDAVHRDMAGDFIF